MKKITSIIFILFSVVLFIPSFSSAVNKEFIDIVEPENNNDQIMTLQISNNIKTKELEEIKNQFINVLKLHDSGVIINDFGTSQYIKYIYDSQGSLKNSMYSSKKQIDLLKKGTTLKIKDFHDINDIELLSGQVNVYCESYCENLLMSLRDTLGVDIIQREKYPVEFDSTLLIISTSFAFLILTLILIIFDMYKKYQLFSIQKLHGFSLKRIWFREIIPIIVNQFIIMTLVFSLLTFICTGRIDKLVLTFLFKGIQLIFIISIVTFVVVSIPILLFAQVNPVDFLKGKTESKSFLNFNQFIFSLVLLITILLVTSLGGTIGSYVSRINNSADWNRMTDYYIIPSYSMNNGGNISSDEKWQNLNKKAFIDLSNKGAIMADFNEFTDSIIKDPQDETPDIGYINSNYLEFHDLRDSENNLIKINNNNPNHIVLLPDNNIFTEKEIKEYYQYAYENEGPLKEIEFIYYDASQKIFTHNSLIIDEFSNSLSEIPLRVTTYENGYVFDYDKIIGYANNPFNIKATSTNEVLTMLNDIGYDNIEFDIISSYDDVEKLNTKDINMILGMGMTMLIMLFIINQSINQGLDCFLSINKKEIAVKRMYGFPILKAFSEYFVLTGKSLAITMVVLYLVSNSIQNTLLIGGISILLIIIILQFKVKKVYASSLSSIFKGKEL